VRRLRREDTCHGEATVRTSYSTKVERGIRTGLPTATQVGHKSNRMYIDPVLNECAARLGVSLRQTEDQLTRDMLASTASFINCVGGVNGDNPTEITRFDIDEVVQSLLSNNAYTIMDNIRGEDRFGTAPVRNAYFRFMFNRFNYIS
jgi:hypothetical protein